MASAAIEFVVGGAGAQRRCGDALSQVMAMRDDRLDRYRGQRVMVTGGLGFIGSNLGMRLLELGAEVLLVDALIPETGGNAFNVDPIKDHPCLSIRKVDIRDILTMERLLRDQDIVFNLAGQVSHLDSMSDPFTDLEINCRSQLALLEACRRNAPWVKVVFASTRQIYGRVPADRLPIKESEPPSPVDVNGINKLGGERYHILYNNVHGIRGCVLRLTNTYGPRMLVKNDRQTFIGWFVRQVIEGEEIRLFGDGLQLRDLTYVDDAVQAFLLAGVDEAADGQVFNVGGLRPYSLREIAETLIDVAGNGSCRLVPFPPDRKAIDVGSVYVDDGKLRESLGWQPTTDLRQGLERTAAFYRQHAEHYLERLPLLV
ncbi:MAG TPA: NAD-dependent epimerase/dehydratase family protein [Chloroflexota bacterium]